MPEISGFARGMVLLLGPLLYLYSRSITVPDFRFRWSHILHFVPYFIAVVFIRIQMHGVDPDFYIMAVDALMSGEVQMNAVATLWFISYFVQLFIYVGLIRYQLKKQSQQQTEQLQLELGSRQKWVNRLSVILAVLGILFLGISIYCLVAKSYSANGNFLYTLILAIAVYVIAYQTILEKEILFPGFSKKYGNNTLTKDLRTRLESQFRQLFEKDKIFTEPDIRLATVATKLGTNPTLVSRFINSEYDQSFNELIHFYRIEEFKRRLVDPRFKDYSILGIAEDVGYNSKSTFNTAFKKLNGMTPTEYLKMIEKK